MAVPKFDEFLLPFLQFCADEKEHSLREAYDAMAEHFNLSAEDRKELLPSGSATKHENRVSWANTYLKKAGFVEMTKRGYFQIAERGKKYLSTNPDSLRTKDLLKFDEFQEFYPTYEKSKRSSSEQTEPEEEVNTTHSPRETIEIHYKRQRDDLADELLNLILDNPPSFFENLVVDLLLAMGYGGSRAEVTQATVTGKSGDEGVDGVISEDKLGLDMIYLQAKRYRDGTVGRPTIQQFAGALQGKRAKKGVFITTSTFSREAVDYATMLDSKIILIDGERLTNLMIDYNVGVSPIAKYELKKVDQDYFTE